MLEDNSLIKKTVQMMHCTVKRLLEWSEAVQQIAFGDCSMHQAASPGEIDKNNDTVKGKLII